MQQCDCHGEKQEKNTKTNKQLSIMLRYLQIALC
jgi:hypothetical protein